MIYVASWPEKRIEAWNALLKARAIENMSYTIGVNRVGTDANAHHYNGNSACYDSMGNCITEENSNREVILNFTVNKLEQNTLRTKFNFLNDRDNFHLK